MKPEQEEHQIVIFITYNNQQFFIGKALGPARSIHRAKKVRSIQYGPTPIIHAMPHEGSCTQEFGYFEL